jgi:hypothetical protein
MTPTCEALPAHASNGEGRGLPVRGQIVLGSCLCAGATAFLFAVDPSRHAVYPQCFLYQTTGIYCAGCGATRALYALLHGRVLTALHDNVLFVVALPFLLAMIGAYAWRSWSANAWAQMWIEGRTLARAGACIFLVMVVFSILRNLPGPVFEWLRPVSG